MNNNRLLRSVIREALLVEKFSRKEESDIKSLARKEIEKLAGKREIEKIFKKQFDEHLKKALGRSFIGTPGRINKFVKDAIHEEVSKMIQDSATKEQIGEITKTIMKKLYRELSFSSPQIIDRIKL